MKRKILKERGITLIALVISIIVLLILAGVTISILNDKNGILKRVQEAKEKTEETARNERVDLDKIGELISEVTSKENTVEQVMDLNPGVLEEENGEKIINSIEDLVFFANSVTNGTTYDGEIVKLGLSLDFNSLKSYVNPYRTDYGKYGYNGELKLLLTNGEGFKPIGITTNESGYEDKSFKGTFDGNEKIIKNLYIDKKVEDNVNDLNMGLFGSNYGEIKKLGLENCNIMGNLTSNGTNTLMLGAIAGKNYGKVFQCFVSGNVTSTGNNSSKVRCGGIIGQMADENSIIQECYNKATVTVTGSNEIIIGGIVGNAENIYNCYNVGNVNATSLSNESVFCIGGIAGSIYNFSAELKNCYNDNEIKISFLNWRDAGGIIGRALKNSNIINCHSKCNFFGDFKFGQIVGLANLTTIKDCSYLKNGSFKSVFESREKVIESNTIEYLDIQSMPKMLAILGDNFTIGLDGYPILKWQVENN